MPPLALIKKILRADPRSEWSMDPTYRFFKLILGRVIDNSNYLIALLCCSPTNWYAQTHRYRRRMQIPTASKRTNKADLFSLPSSLADDHEGGPYCGVGIIV